VTLATTGTGTIEISFRYIEALAPGVLGLDPTTTPH
jgi:hypothetical protein